jgi:hypothetical protein
LIVIVHDKVFKASSLPAVACFRRLDWFELTCFRRLDWFELTCFRRLDWFELTCFEQPSTSDFCLKTTSFNVEHRNAWPYNYSKFANVYWPEALRLINKILRFKFEWIVNGHPFLRIIIYIYNNKNKYFVMRFNIYYIVWPCKIWFCR